LKLKRVLYLSSLLIFSSAISFPQQDNCTVKKITVYRDIFKRGGNPAYNPNGDGIVYQKFLNGNYEIAVSDTAMSEVDCLTCNKFFLPKEIRNKKHKGNAQYHPGGNYIIFTSENKYGRHLITTVPGAGTNHDIFIMSSSGKKFWKLTDAPKGHAILHPAFSHKGTQLLWCEMYYSTLKPDAGEEYGLWNLKLADFNIDNDDAPSITNIKTFAPLDSVWYESHSFSPDDKTISFTSHQKGKNAYYGDIYTMEVNDISTGNVKNITSSPLIHDEHSHWSPDGKKISWISGKYIGGLSSYISELYIMNSDGSDPVRLTHFSESGYDEYIQDEIVVADHYWSPDGTRIFGFVHFTSGISWQSMLFVVEFNGSCGKS
jgi:hypothetical protein